MDKPKVSVHNGKRGDLTPDHQNYVRTLRRARDRRREIRRLKFKLLELEAQQNYELLQAEMLAGVLKRRGIAVLPRRYAPETDVDLVPENPPLDGFDLFMPNEKPMPQVG